jgi:predicted amidophosphoribosyltransferase
MISYRDRQSFIDEFMDKESLNKAIEFIKNNIAIDDVYDTGAMVEFIKNNIAIDDVYDTGAMVDWVKKNEAPGDVFSDSELSDWANDNGFIHESKLPIWNM